MSALAAHALLGRVRRRFRARGSRRSNGDTGYLFYALILAIGTAVFPLARAAVVAAASPAAREWFRTTLAADGGWQFAAVAVGCGFAVLSGIGALRGPVAPGPFWVTLLTAGPLPGRYALLRQFAVPVLLLAVALASLGALLGAASDEGVQAILRIVLVGGGVALLGGCAWLLGQVLERRSWALALVVALAVAASAVIRLPFTPWGLAGAAITWPGAGEGDAFGATAPEPIGALALLWLIAVAALCAVPRLLDRLRPHALSEQAAAWERVGSSAGLGDFATALGAIRASPSKLRRVRAIRSLPQFSRHFIRDVIGAARTPVRLAVACLTLAGCGMLASWGSGNLSSGTAVAVVGVLVGRGSYLAISALTDGFRHAAVAAGAPALYGVSTARLYALHASFPVVAGIVLVIAGGVAWGGNGPWGALTVLVAVAARAFDSLKGPLPVLLATTPISSPAGDPGIFFQLLWRADALLFASAAGAVILASGEPAPFLAFGAAGVAGLLLVWGTLRRIARG